MLKTTRYCFKWKRVWRGPDSRRKLRGPGMLLPWLQGDTKEEAWRAAERAIGHGKERLIACEGDVVKVRISEVGP